MKTNTNVFSISRFLITSLAIGVALLLWFKGFLQSPALIPHQVHEMKFLSDYLEQNMPDLQQERKMAESYWLRYQDVRDDPYWGENGPMGIWGARDHYEIHGRSEGRIYQPVMIPEDRKQERALAEAYWNRYPEIRKSAIWGEKSGLGILGPRDHYRYVGIRQGKIWGVADNAGE